ncbi:MAG: ATP synthase F0 subunit B [Deltaproteobacteria bacterium]|jgi:F-type H+-transporting ATPase subunit b|nr:ATP synthase F0 subunit B [Deltaproteobacteria bacterium]
MKRRCAVALSLILFALPASAADPSASGLEAFLWPAVNLIILISVLVYFARKPLRAYFDKRRSGIQGELETAAEQLATAESTYANWQRRMIELDGELEAIRATSRQRAEAERERIIADARASADRIRRDAVAAVELELRRAREVLREEAAQLAIELAGERLTREVTDGDRDRLVDEFIDLIAAAPDSAANQREGA